MRVPLLLFQPDFAQSHQIFSRLGKPFQRMLKGLALDLNKAGIDVTSEAYIGASIASAIAWGMLFGLMAFAYFSYVKPDFPMSAELSLLAVLLFLALHLYYPRIISNNKSEQVDQNLLFALRDMLIQVSAGVSLYEAIRNISIDGYGELSLLMRHVIVRVEAGTNLMKALEDIAFRTNSEYLKKIVWQLITALYAGANLSVSLKSIVQMLVDYNRNLIKNYTAELNFLILIYLLAAAVMPTIGMTVMIIFSVFSVIQVSESMFIGLIGLSFAVQLMLAGYMLVKRPHLY